MSGSKQPAEKGQLIFLCGGDKELYDRSTPLLDVMGKAKFHLGEVCMLCKVIVHVTPCPVQRLVHSAHFPPCIAPLLWLCINDSCALTK